MIVLPDTNAFTGLLLGNELVVHCLEHAEQIVVSPVVLGELQFGYRFGAKEKENLAFLEAFLAKPFVRVLCISEETASVYADIRLKLKKMGKPIPSNDLWIAAQAIEKGAVLISEDAHFSVITGLRLVEY